MTLREKIQFWFEDVRTPMGKAVDLIVIVLIVLACGLTVAMTWTEDGSPTYILLTRIDQGVSLLFLVEYLLRLWSSKRPLRYAFSLYGLVDFVAILPAFAEPGFRLIRILRLFRIFRLLRYLESRHFFFGTVTEVHLYVSRVLFTLFSILFLTAGLVFYAERGHNPNIPTFLEAFYFSVVALTTVGFGDIVPITSSGRAATILMIFAGIIFIPWQVKSLVSYMLLQQGKNERSCNSCGLNYHEPDARHCKRCGVRLPVAPMPDDEIE